MEDNKLSSVDFLRNCSLFQGLPDDCLLDLIENLELLTFEEEQPICHLGDEGGGLFFIRKGQVRVWLDTPTGEKETICFLGPGDYFGEMSLLTKEPVSANVSATLRTRIFFLQAQHFHDFCQQNPVIYREISKTLSRRLRETNRSRFTTHLGKVTRLLFDQPPSSSQVALGLSQLLLRSLTIEGIKRPVLVIRVPYEWISRDQKLKDSPLFSQEYCCFEDEVAVPRVLDDHPVMIRRWKCRHGGEMILWCPNDRFEMTWLQEYFVDVLTHLRALYPQVILYNQETYESPFQWLAIPDEHRIVVLDLRDDESQIPATREDYDIYSLESHRYPPVKGREYWKLAPNILTSLFNLRAQTKKLGIQRDRISFLLLHQPDRPFLDFPHILAGLKGYSVHPLPLQSDNHLPPDRDSQDTILSFLMSSKPSMALSRIARDLGNLQIGLALGGGGARGYAHVGVLQVLEENGIQVDFLSGSSFGAVIAAGYSEGRTSQRVADDMRYHWVKIGNLLLDVFDYCFPRSYLLRGRKISKMIREAMATALIEHSQRPLSIICTDLITGNEVVLEEGPLGLATRASGSLPGIFKPVIWGNSLLVDGAVLNKVPARVLRQRGASVVLAVNVTPERDSSFNESGKQSGSLFRSLLKKIPGLDEWLSYPNILQIISRSMNVSGLQQSRIHQDQVDVEIKPRTEQFDFLRFDQFDEIVEAGRQAALEMLPKIQQALRSVRDQQNLTFESAFSRESS